MSKTHTRFVFFGLVFVVATVLLFVGKIDAEVWKWSVTVAGGGFGLAKFAEHLGLKAK